VADQIDEILAHQGLATTEDDDPNTAAREILQEPQTFLVGQIRR
jgi:alpha-D-ribose 1-methylphosphonate 5-triphosphate synthase subunit PhnI